MPDKSTPEIVYRFTPQFDGAHLAGVPRGDLTAKDVSRLDPMKRRDAFAPHPLYGTPLYTAVGGAEKKTQDAQIADWMRAHAPANAAATSPESAGSGTTTANAAAATKASAGTGAKDGD